MPNVCKLCAHPRRPQIEQLLLEGTAYKRIQERYGISPAAICRHQKGGHLLPMVARKHETAVAKQEAEREDVITSRLESLYDTVETGIADAKRAVRTVRDPKTGEEMPVGRDFTPLAQLVNQGHRNIELLARATGRFSDAPTSQTACVLILPPAERPSQTERGEVIDVEPCR